MYFSRVSGKLDYSRAQSCQVVSKGTDLQLIGNVMRRGEKRKLFRIILKISATSLQEIRGTALQARRLRVRFPILSLKFFIDIILPATLWPWG